MDYTFSIGTDDPRGFAAENDRAAVARAVGFVLMERAEMVRSRPEVVVVLLGPNGLVTRPSERLDEFVARLPGEDAMTGSGSLQPGDSNAPDCNAD